MHYKKKSQILVLFTIVIIQILLLINNRQKTSFRYFIWNIQEVSIGKLIFISFVSGLLMSSILNKTIINDISNKPIIEDDEKISDENDHSENIEENNVFNDITPERDLRDPQPTISVNYRVVKNNDLNELKDRTNTKKNSQYDDDWTNNNSEW